MTTRSFKAVVLCAIYATLAPGCSTGPHAPTVVRPPTRSAYLRFLSRYLAGGNAQVLDANMCVTAVVECTGEGDSGQQHTLAIPGTPCVTQRSSGRQWVHAQGITQVPWPCRGAGEVWASALVPDSDANCQHAHAQYAASSEHGSLITANIVLECHPDLP